jgi:hypothetical protein
MGNKSSEDKKIFNVAAAATFYCWEERLMPFAERLWLLKYSTISSSKRKIVVDEAISG